MQQEQQIILPEGVTIRGPGGERYVVEGLLGKGEMGAVYLVRDRHIKGQTPALFALKEVINPDKQDRERFAFEGDVLKRLQHRALPRVYHVFENDNLKRAYIVMDYIKGRNLEDLRGEQPYERFSLPLVLALLSPIVEAVIYLHTQDPPIVHRDIKPANIIVPIGADEAMLVDFGSAKEYVSSNHATVRARYSPGFAAPEQYAGGSSPRTDIYGLGATLYTLLTGIEPPAAPTRVSKAWGDRPDPLKSVHQLNSGIPQAVAGILQRAMSISSADRFASVEEFWQALNDQISPVTEPIHIPRVTSATAASKLLPPPEKQTEQIARVETNMPLSRRLVMASIIILVLIITLIFTLYAGMGVR